MRHLLSRSLPLGITIGLCWSICWFPVAPGDAQPPAEQDQENPEVWRRVPERPTSVTVTFDSFRVFEKTGQLHVDFELRDGTLETLKKFDIHLWLSAHVKRENIAPSSGYTATETLSGTNESITFPDWLDIPASRRIHLCLMGTTPADNLALGRGYFCTEWTMWDVKTRRKASDAIVALTIEYRPGVMPYPSRLGNLPQLPDY